MNNYHDCEFALASTSLGHNQAATALLEKALALFRAAGSALGEGHTTLKLGLLKLGWVERKGALFIWRRPFA